MTHEEGVTLQGVDVQEEPVRDTLVWIKSNHILGGILEDPLKNASLQSWL